MFWIVFAMYLAINTVYIYKVIRSFLYMKKIVLVLLAGLSLISAQKMVHDDHGYADNQIYVKFPDDKPVPFYGKYIDLSEMGESALATELYSKGHFVKVHKVSPDKLTQMRRTAEKNLGKKLPDPNTEFYFYIYEPSDFAAVKQLLESSSAVETVLPVPIPYNAIAPDFQTDQGYITVATSGIEATSFWNTYGNRGEGVKVCDIEYGFNADHVDFPTITILGGTPVDPFTGDGISHGTGVFGEIISLNNGTGTTGIASSSEAYFAGAYVDNIYDLAGPITLAASNFNPGDVILLEQQIAGPNASGSGQFGLVPVEWYKPFYDAIVLAVGNNVIVVEAAGNGEQNLDDVSYNMGNGGHYPFLPGGESGAIIVGAGCASTSLGGSGVARSRMWYSNYGFAVDVQGNGEAVTTTGYGDLYSSEGPNAYYTDGFSGTSSASPIVTGAVLLLQSMYKDTTGNIITPQQMLDLLIETGKPQMSGVYNLEYHIGPLPDVMNAFYMIYAGLGVEENSQNQLMIYPNPSDGNFNILIKENNLEMSSFTLKNIQGEEVSYTISETGNGIYNVNLNLPSAGIYFAQCEVDGKFYTSRVVIVP